jgi:SAM-dependent methyltransferase
VPDTRLIDNRFPRSNKYDPDWIRAGVSGGAHPLWLTEWLSGALDLQPGMRVLDLGCGRALSSIFLHREFGVQVWATDLWFSPTENRQRIHDAGCEHGVFPLRADARSLPFAHDFFDAIVSIDSFSYYGTDQHYLSYLARHVRPGGTIGVAGAGLMREIEGAVPQPLQQWWEPSLWSLHAAAWWQRHWERTGIIDVKLADSMPEGWQLWLQWQQVVAPENQVELEAVTADRGTHLGCVRAIGRRRSGVMLEEPITSVDTEYASHPLLRSSESTGPIS